MIAESTCLFFCNPRARAESHRQKRAKKMSLTKQVGKNYAMSLLCDISAVQNRQRGQPLATFPQIPQGFVSE